ncbi:c-type cytochrome [Thalassospira alkalitolerans]|uniref:c-type cytochrome n=1 Tax=Thalassospira alkalitolerans TaxID=1293890 RepID=UPI00146EDB81|nr:cytochrome c [Thalassospira alkalitolerans]
MKTGLLIGTAILATIVNIAAFAHQGATGVVMKRMDGMEIIGKQVKMMVPMLKGQTAYDPAKVEQAAKKIRNRAGSAFTKLFPHGSNDHPSEAAPEIWDKWNSFSELADKLATTATTLKQVAAKDIASGNNNDADAFQDAFRNMLQTCKSCHQQFRTD